MVCITYLEINGGPAALHYLVRRLRQRIPRVTILVGLWPSDDAVLKDDGFGRLSGPITSRLLCGKLGDVR